LISIADIAQQSRGGSLLLWAETPEGRRETGRIKQAAALTQGEIQHKKKIRKHAPKSIPSQPGKTKTPCSRRERGKRRETKKTARSQPPANSHGKKVLHHKI